MRSKFFNLPNEYILQRLEFGKSLQIQGKLIEAEAIYMEILSRDPDDKNAIFMLGTLFQQLGKQALAINLFRRLIGMAGDVAAVYNNLGGCYHQECFDDEARFYYTKANELANYSDPDMLSNLGGTYINVNDAANGIPYFDKALQINPDHYHSKWNRSLCYLEMGEYEKGFKDYDSGLLTGDRKNKDYAVPEWDGSDCDCLVICGEQGIGDEVMFTSLLTRFVGKVKKIVFDCHPRLEGIFKNHIIADDPNIEYVVIPNRKEVDNSLVLEHKPQYRVNVGSLGKHFIKSKEDFKPEPFYIKENLKSTLFFESVIKAKVGNNLKVGLSWFGGGKKTRVDLRSIPLPGLVPLLSSDNCSFINLQYNTSVEELEGFKKDFGLTIHHIIDDTDFTNYCWLIASCDLVVTVCTSLAHLCGALGVPCLVMVPKRCAWRYSHNRDTMIWYKSVKFVRQSIDDHWEDVVLRTRNLARNFNLETFFEMEINHESFY